MFEISRLNAARQLGQPLHSQSANFGMFTLNSWNLAGIILDDSLLDRDPPRAIQLAGKVFRRRVLGLADCKRLTASTSQLLGPVT